jgi:hypothetical protein
MRGGKFIGAVPLILACGCASGPDNIEIRALPTALAQGARPISARVAEARGQLALGNVALALEGFRKAVREDPQSVEAMVGMSACYDQMGRFDLSRRYYEQALAVVPTSTQVLGLLARSLDNQGLRAEAAKVRAEIALVTAPVVAKSGAPASLSEPVPALATTAPVPAAASPALASRPDPVVAVEDSIPAVAIAQASPPLAIGHSITVKLPPARLVALFEQHPPAVPASAPRLERMSRGEVALVTTARPLWRPYAVATNAGSAAIRFVPLRSRDPRVELLNAARIDRLAARTRSWLVQRGWSAVAIGNAPAVRSRSIILYPASQRALAQRLAAHFGFAMAVRHGGPKVTVLLGRDAARAPSGAVPPA